MIAANPDALGFVLMPEACKRFYENNMSITADMRTEITSCLATLCRDKRYGKEITLSLLCSCTLRMPGVLSRLDGVGNMGKMIIDKIKKEVDVELSNDPEELLFQLLAEGFRSLRNPRADAYRNMKGITEIPSLTIAVQLMDASSGKPCVITKPSDADEYEIKDTIFGKVKVKKAKPAPAPSESTVDPEKAHEIAQELYEQGKSKEAVKYYIIAAKGGHAASLNSLGWHYRHGDGVEADTAKAVECFEAAIKNGNMKGAANLGEMYYYGDGDLEEDSDKAFFYLEKAAMAGIGYAMPPLSDLYYRGDGRDENQKLAAYWAHQAVKHGNKCGYYWLGIYFHEGYFFPECPSYAKYCFEQAKEQGMDVSEYLEDEKYDGILPVNPTIMPFDDDASDFFTQECPCQQYIRALTLLDGKTLGGKVIPVDADEGRRLLEISAGQGYANAQLSLGLKLLDSGEGYGVRYNEDGEVTGFAPDVTKALYWLDCAAVQGNKDALEALADLYAAGEIGIEQDTEKSNHYQTILYALYQDEADAPDDCSVDDGDTAVSVADADTDSSYSRIEYENGDVYEGELSGGKYHGNGKYYYANGDVYEGGFENGLSSGYGVYRSSNGNVYEGEYKNDERSGKGKYTFADGETYEGDYLNGQRCGYGECSYADGCFYKGSWRDGKRHGVGRFNYDDGRWHFGQFDYGCTTGYGVYFDGQMYHIGLFDDGVCETERKIKSSMRRPVVTTIGKGATTYSDMPKDQSGYTIFRAAGKVLYIKNDQTWVARYDNENKKMEMGRIDRNSHLNDSNSVTIQIDEVIAVGSIVNGVPNGRNTVSYISGESFVSDFVNGSPARIISQTDKYGNEEI